MISRNSNVCNLSLKPKAARPTIFYLRAIEFKSTISLCLSLLYHIYLSETSFYFNLFPHLLNASLQHKCIVEMMLYNHANVFKLNVHCSKMLRRIFHSSSYFANNVQYEVYINIICSKFYMH